MVSTLSGKQIRDSILKRGYSTTETTVYSWKNATEGIANTGKGALTAQCGSRVGPSAFKATKGLHRRDVVCATLCSISMGCETICGVIIWVSMLYKFTTIAVLKAISHGSTKFRDMCANDPSNPAY